MQAGSLRSIGSADILSALWAAGILPASHNALRRYNYEEMAGGENFLAQLKAVVDPLTIFNHYLSLKKSGNRFKALCPFHNEKTPSFYAASNGMFHCFGCGAGGDVIAFVMQMEKLDFKECIQLLSSRYGIPLKFTTTGERKEKDELLDLMRQAADFYHNLLTTHESGKAALQYLEERGITRDTIRRFQLGWAPASWSSLLEHFSKRDVNPSLLVKCGLVVARQSEGFYDRYRSRVMIPIHDIHGSVIALGGRIFQGTGEEAKYLNSPETLLYSKSNQLFGLYFSKEFVQEKNIAILVEGYFDMIMPFQAGYQNIVASLGTSLTENQARLLRRYTDRIVIFYDPDTAGKAAVLRALPILLKENFVVSVGSLPPGLDPDTFIRERGGQEFQNEMDHAIRYDQLLILHLEQKYDLKTSTGKLSASDEIFGMLEAVTNPFEKVKLMKDFAVKVGISPEMMHEQYRRKKKTGTVERSSISRMDLSGTERRLLQIFLLAPAIARQLLAEFNDEDFEELSRADLFRQLQQITLTNEDVTTVEIIHSFPPEIQRLLTPLIMDEGAPEPSLDLAKEWLNQKIRRTRKGRSARKLDLEIEEARKKSDHTLLDELLSRKLALTRESKD